MVHAGSNPLDDDHEQGDEQYDIHEDGLALTIALKQQGVQ
jgi:hypothetical protein